MPDEKQLENLFIQEELDQHGEYLIDLLQEAIENKTLKLTGDLQEAMHYVVNKREGRNSLALSFYGYGRAIEIRYHLSKNTRKLQQPSANRMLLGLRDKPQAKKKNTQWYSKNVYGSLNQLIGRVMYGMSEQERQRLTRIIETAAENGQINLSNTPKTFAQ